MAARAKRTKHIGILMRGSTGELYVLRDDDEAPKPYKKGFAPRMRPALPKQGKEQTITFPVPQDVLDELEAAGYLPDWCWVFCSAARLR